MSDKPTSSKRNTTKTQDRGERLNVDTSGMSEKERAELAESLVTPARKQPSARQNVNQEAQKTGKTTGQDKPNVKSGQKAPAGRKKPAEKKPAGRPSDYNQAIADLICEALAEGHSLRRICQADNMPNKGTVFRWLAAHESFRDQYSRAREAQADCLFDDMIEIADDGTNDTYTDENGNLRTDHDVIARSKLRVETRKWMAGKLKPKVYGDKVDLNHGVQPDNPLAALLAQIKGSALPVATDDE